MLVQSAPGLMVNVLSPSSSSISYQLHINFAAIILVSPAQALWGTSWPLLSCPLEIAAWEHFLGRKLMNKDLRLSFQESGWSLYPGEIYMWKMAFQPSLSNSYNSFPLISPVLFCVCHRRCSTGTKSITGRIKGKFKIRFSMGQQRKPIRRQQSLDPKHILGKQGS